MRTVEFQSGLMLAQSSIGTLQTAFVVIAAIVLIAPVILSMTRFKRCPADKILVVFGRLPNGEHARCYHGGGVFVWPLIQSHAYMDLQPISIAIEQSDLRDASGQRFRIGLSSTVVISTDPAGMRIAADRLLMLKPDQIRNLADDIIRGITKEAVARVTADQLNARHEDFESDLQRNVSSELGKAGLMLLDLTITKVEAIRTPYVAEVLE